MKIIKLTSENIKRLQAVEITPDGSLVVIGGKNAQGKTSVLDSIEYALGGTSSIPKQPIHKGKHIARIVVELDGIIVTRTFNESGSKLVVSDKEGFTKSSPQALLDSLVGKLSFDPLVFIGMKSDEQLKIVKELAGIDFSKFDEETKKIYDDRTMVNREIKSIQAQAVVITPYEGVPESEVSYPGLLKERDRRAEINTNNKKEWIVLEMLNNDIAKSDDEINELKKQIAELRARWDRTLERHGNLIEERHLQEEKVENIKEEDVGEISLQIQQADEINQKVRSNLKRNELQFDLELRQQNVEKITKRLEEIEDKKLKLISSSKLPIQGLTFDSSTLYYNDIPFTDQSSSAEQLRISVAMGFAMNPKLKILLIRDGSLLDEDNLKMIAEMAEKENGQLWLEMVSTDKKKCQVIIEDGRVKND